MDELIALLARVQMPDGYLFTYNRINYPGQRWANRGESQMTVWVNCGA